MVAQWDTGRDFFVVEKGAVDVVIDGEVVATLRAGEFFGEIAALEWGAGLRAVEDRDAWSRGTTLRLRVLAPEQLARLLEAFPRLEREIRRQAHDRLRQLG